MGIPVSGVGEITTHGDDGDRQTAARVAGVATLLGLAAILCTQFFVDPRLFVAGDLGATAHNLVAHETLFRAGSGCYLVYAAANLALLAALYRILAPVGQGLALYAALARLVYAGVWILLAIDRLDALRLIADARNGSSFGSAGAHALANFLLSHWNAYYVGLAFYAVAMTLFGYLWLLSRFIPRVLAIGTLLGSLWCAFCTIAYLLFPRFAQVVGLNWFDTPIAIFEIATGIWLLVRGIRPAGRRKVGPP
jgi:hypothetical protein